MNKLITTTLLLCFSLYGVAQGSKEIEILENLIDLGEVSKGNRDFSEYDKLDSLFNGVEIVMLGEQSHGDGTTFDTKIKLIQYLHEKQGFDILAFEAGFYDCNKAWTKMINGMPADVAMAKSVFQLWSAMGQFKYLTNYLDSSILTKNPIEIVGFDIQFTGDFSKEYYSADLTNYIKSIDSSYLGSKNYEQLIMDIKSLTEYQYKELKKAQVIEDTILINQLLESINTSPLKDSFWSQSLISLKYYLSDSKLKMDCRDEKMAENLIWIKNKYPNKKIICWGATSHFMYNSEEIEMLKFPFSIIDNYYKKVPSMGNYIKDEYNEKVLTVGFVTYEGEFRNGTKKKEIKPVHENSLEKIIGKSKYNNCALPLNNLDVEGLYSRPLAHQYMTNNIKHIMDVVIFNRTMTYTWVDRKLYLKLHPNNKWAQKSVKE
jgi:erythromycin esterase